MNLRLGCKSKKALGRNVGVTLLEVLVSLLVLSLGLLGVAGLQAVTASYKVNSWARNSAALLLSDFAERVRANPAAAAVSTGLGRYEFKTNWTLQKVPIKPKDCLQSSCNYTERADYDLWDWRTRVASEMPQGSVWVEGDRDRGFEVTLMWMDKGFTGTGANDDQLQRSENCRSGLSVVKQTSCCPDDADVARGVRCQRFFFIP